MQAQTKKTHTVLEEAGNCGLRVQTDIWQYITHDYSG